jgi:hypothetical protein
MLTSGGTTQGVCGENPYRGVRLKTGKAVVSQQILWFYSRRRRRQPKRGYKRSQIAPRALPRSGRNVSMKPLPGGRRSGSATEWRSSRTAAILPTRTGRRPDFGSVCPDERDWGGLIFTAQNQRLVYRPMIKNGDFEMMKPQFTFYTRMLKSEKKRTEYFFG